MSRTELIISHRRKAWCVSVIALLAFACLALVSPIFGQQTFVGAHGRLSVKGNNIVDRNGNPTTLHGMSLYCWAPQGKQFFNTSAINHLAQDWKCTVIRIAVLPRDYKNNPTDEIDRVKTVIDACIANGIYAIVDWHSMGGAQNDLAASQSFFSTLAAAYGKTPNIMYEPWNEPVQESWEVIKAYHEAVISKIRANDPDNIIIWRQQALGPGMRRGISESDRELTEHCLFDTLLRGDSPAVASRQRGESAEKWRRSVCHRIRQPARHPAAARMIPRKPSCGGIGWMRTISGLQTGRLRHSARRPPHFNPAPAPLVHGPMTC